ncbi:MAG: hypothetical protein NC225_10480 [Clostridium sp.]|nr:hypothetical protein [Clostridium sp.]MCM1399891.1 hypothetical protein [Clostridium sp.]MCM1460694.1 hypothetical protein [Bacteroides sp.]
MNGDMLREIMTFFGDTNETLACFLGISVSTFSAKLNEQRGAEFNQGEIIKIIKRYNLTKAQIEKIFFA